MDWLNNYCWIETFPRSTFVEHVHWYTEVDFYLFLYSIALIELYS